MFKRNVLKDLEQLDGTCATTKDNSRNIIATELFMEPTQMDSLKIRLQLKQSKNYWMIKTQ
jgi:hypothetical protein